MSSRKGVKKASRFSLSRFAVCMSVISIVCVGAAVVFFLTREPEPETEEAFEYEENVTIGQMPGVDREAQLAALQANTDAAAIAFSINSTPAIIGTEMNLLFENPDGNGKDISLSIYENETGEVIYRSKAIREGNYLATVNITKEYAPGTYEATARIMALDKETHEVIGETAAGLTIQVLQP